MALKETREGNEINILGVISPYFKLGKDVVQLKYNAFRTAYNIEQKITILGETSLNDINYYIDRFSKRNLEINFNQKNFIPDWILEYPKEFYTNRDKLKNKFLKKSITYPNFDEYKILNKNYISYFLSLGIDLPNDLDRVLNKEQLNFYNRLKGEGKKTITKPFLYLAIVSFSIENHRKQNFYLYL